MQLLTSTTMRLLNLDYLPLYDHNKAQSEEIARGLITDAVKHGNAFFGMLSCFDLVDPEKLTDEDAGLLEMIVEIAIDQASSEAA